MSEEQKSVLLPGSYDPVTRGHMDIICAASREAERVYVVVFINPSKKCLFTPEERVLLLDKACTSLPNVTVEFDDGLVVNYARRHGIKTIIKGYRNDADLAYEQKMAEYNRTLAPEIKTVLKKCLRDFEFISSSAARQALHSGADLSLLLPPESLELTLSLYRKKSSATEG